MELIPAIDLLDRKVVRLHQGKYDEVTIYDDDPVAMARRFEEQGAKRLHVVDLEGAEARRDRVLLGSGRGLDAAQRRVGGLAPDPVGAEHVAPARPGVEADRGGVQPEQPAAAA